MYQASGDTDGRGMMQEMQMEILLCPADEQVWQRSLLPPELPSESYLVSCQNIQLKIKWLTVCSLFPGVGWGGGFTFNPLFACQHYQLRFAKLGQSSGINVKIKSFLALMLLLN